MLQEHTWPYWAEESRNELVVKFNDNVVFRVPRGKTLGGGDTKEYTYAREHIHELIQSAEKTNKMHITIDLEDDKFVLCFPHNWCCAYGGGNEKTEVRSEMLVGALLRLASEINDKQIMSGTAKDLACIGFG